MKIKIKRDAQKIKRKMCISILKNKKIHNIILLEVYKRIVLKISKKINKIPPNVKIQTREVKKKTQEIAESI